MTDEQRLGSKATMTNFHIGVEAMSNRKALVRNPWTKEDVRALNAHSKARTPAAEVAKTMKRTESAVRQKANTVGIGLVTDANDWLRSARSVRTRMTAPCRRRTIQ
jgi:hypothetical protein